MKLALPLAVIVTFLAAAASGAVLHVPQEHATIQAAIDASISGDVVLVAPGAYHEALTFRGRRITLKSTAGPAETILDGSSFEMSILTARGGENLSTRVEGFTFRHGFGTTTVACNLTGRKGGAILVLNAGLSIIDCVFEDNGAADEGNGGAIFACAADVSITLSRFDRNLAAHGGAIQYLGLSTLRLMIDRSSFRENAASSGGAISGNLQQSTELTIDGSQFEANDGGGGGGAMDLYASGAAKIAITGTTFAGNHSSHGGAVLGYFTGSAEARVEGCQFTGGVAVEGGGASFRASQDALVEMTNCDFRNNETAGGGGLFAVAMGTPPEPGGRVRINACRFFDNVAHECCGAGLFIDSCFTDGPPPRGNGLNFGGGADLRTVSAGSVVLSNSLFAGNSAPRGGGVHVGSCAGGTIDLVNCTIVDNDGGVQLRLGSPKLIGASDVSAITLVNSIVRGNGNGQVAIDHEYAPSTASATYNDIEGGFAGAGNVDLAPSFVDAAARDYRLSSGSACIDAGDNRALDAAITRDLAGQPRFADDPRTRDHGAGNGPQVDLGAYEFHPGTAGRRRVAVY
jgi:hypothetical protein